MESEEKLADIMGRYLDMHTKMIDCMQKKDIQNEKLEDILKEIKFLIDKIDNYPLRTLERLDEIREKLGGEEGLRNYVQRYNTELTTINQKHHAELKTIIRNYQLVAAAIITIFSIIIKTQMG